MVEVASFVQCVIGSFRWAKPTEDLNQLPKVLRVVEPTDDLRQLPNMLRVVGSSFFSARRHREQFGTSSALTARGSLKGNDAMTKFQAQYQLVIFIPVRKFRSSNVHNTLFCRPEILGCSRPAVEMIINLQDSENTFIETATDMT